MGAAPSWTRVEAGMNHMKSKVSDKKLARTDTKRHSSKVFIDNWR